MESEFLDFSELCDPNIMLPPVKVSQVKPIIEINPAHAITDVIKFISVEEDVLENILNNETESPKTPSAYRVNVGDRGYTELNSRYYAYNVTIKMPGIVGIGSGGFKLCLYNKDNSCPHFIKDGIKVSMIRLIGNGTLMCRIKFTSTTKDLNCWCNSFSFNIVVRNVFNNQYYDMEGEYMFDEKFILLARKSSNKRTKKRI